MALEELLHVLMAQLPGQTSLLVVANEHEERVDQHTRKIAQVFGSLTSEHARYRGIGAGRRRLIEAGAGGGAQGWRQLSIV